MVYDFYRHGKPRPCLQLNPEPPGSTMTVPIVGVPRGGTTMVAAVVHSLGIDLGPAKDLAEFTFEDQTMNKADPGLELSYIKRRNHEKNIWGWKNPAALQSIRPLFFSLRKPRLIMVFRDIMATMDGEMRFDEATGIEPRRAFCDLAEATTNWWAENMQFIIQTTFPTLLVSYEHALRSPELFIQSLGEFLGIAPTHEQLTEAMARINPQGGYLRIDEQGHPIQRVEPEPETVAAPVTEG